MIHNSQRYSSSSALLSVAPWSLPWPACPEPAKLSAARIASRPKHPLFKIRPSEPPPLPSLPVFSPLTLRCLIFAFYPLGLPSSSLLHHPSSSSLSHYIPPFSPPSVTLQGLPLTFPIQYPFSHSPPSLPPSPTATMRADVPVPSPGLDPHHPLTEANYRTIIIVIVAPPASPPPPRHALALLSPPPLETRACVHV